MLLGSVPVHCVGKSKVPLLFGKILKIWIILRKGEGFRVRIKKGEGFPLQGIKFTL